MTRTVVPLVSVIAVILASLVTGALSAPASAASPSEGSISDTSPNTTWAGQFYPVGGTTLPEECPPPDPANVRCDHFFLTIAFTDPGFWDSHAGQVTIRIEWPSSDNDFDLYVYGPDGGGLAGSSEAGGTTSEEVALLSPTPGTYEVRVVPFLVINSGYSGQASLFFTSGRPAPNPIRPTGGIGIAPSVIAEEPRHRPEHGGRPAVVRGGQRAHGVRLGQHDLPHVPPSALECPGVLFSRLDGPDGSRRRTRLHELAGGRRRRRHAGRDVRPDPLRPRVPEPVPRLPPRGSHRGRPGARGPGPEDRDILRGAPPPREPGGDRGGHLPGSRRGLGGERVRDVGRREGPQRVRERVPGPRDDLVRALACEWEPREHERVGVVGRGRPGDPGPRLVRHLRAGGPGRVPELVRQPPGGDDRPLVHVLRPGELRLHEPGRVRDLPGPRERAPEPLRADLPRRPRMHDEQRGPHDGGLPRGRDRCGGGGPHRVARHDEPAPRRGGVHGEADRGTGGLREEGPRDGTRESDGGRDRGRAIPTLLPGNGSGPEPPSDGLHSRRPESAHFG